MKLYDGTIDIQFSPAAHRYKVNGHYVEGVTTFLRILNKDGLMQWTANMVLNYIKENCKTGNNLFYSVTDEHLSKAKYAHMNIRDEAAEVGKDVHKWIEEHLKGNDLEVSVLMRPSVDAYLEWEARAEPQYLNSERVVYSKKHDYCGTVDAVMMLDGKRTVMDFKTGKPDDEYNTKTKRYTGKKRARYEHFVQDAFYDIAISEEDGVEAEQYAVLYIPVNGKVYCYTTTETKTYRQMALSVLSTHRLKKKIDKLNLYREEQSNG